jgi:hypothetical protein
MGTTRNMFVSIGVRLRHQSHFLMSVFLYKKKFQGQINKNKQAAINAES